MNREERRQAQAKVDELNQLYRRYCDAVHNAGPFPSAIMGIEALDQSLARAENYRSEQVAFSRYHRYLTEQEKLPLTMVENTFYLLA